jgi:hypothetical protein
MRILWPAKNMRRVNMSGTMTDQDLLDRGFKQFPPTYPIDPTGVKNKYQKCYSDEIGRRYFITVSEWEPIFDRRTGKTWPINYEYHVYFQKDDGKGSTKAIKILLYAGWDIDEVEDYVQKLFETGLFEYYEKWEDC